MKVDPIAQERLGTMLFYGIVIVLVYFTYRVIEPVLVPMVWAAILVVVTHRVAVRLKRRFGRTRGAALATLGATLVLIVPALALGYEFVQQAIQFFHTLSNASASGQLDWLNRMWQHIQQRFSSFGPIDLAGSLRRYAAEAATYIAGKLGTIVAHALAFVFDLFVMLITTFYLYRDGEGMLARLREVLPFLPGQREKMLDETQDLIVVSVISSGLGALLHGVLIGAMFAGLGVSPAVFWGVMIAFVSFVPVFGAAIVWVPASIVLMGEGHILRGILLLLLSMLVSTVIDYWFRPWVISGRGEMGGLAVFIGVVGGILYFGLIGIVLGPIILALAASLMDLYRGGSRRGNRLANTSEG
ncbi:MAG: AI-2E family transporter [Candidatus Acidiferrales bacterium]